jgi:hypothetical protein
MSGGGPITRRRFPSRANMKRLALAVLLVLMASPSAAAQEDGVFVDPDSPAGKEYAVPIDQARGEAAGGSNRPPGEEPLFGEGIEPAAGGSGTKNAGGGGGDTGQQGSTRNGSKREGSRREGDATGGDAPQSSSNLPQSPAAIEAAAAEGSDGLLSAGIAAAVLGVGMLAGFCLRRLLRSG